MLALASTENRLFPATMYFNEGWLLRLVLDWFSHHYSIEHVLSFHSDARWFSEALLPSQFFARKQGDHLAEGWTHADGVIGHVAIGDSALADTKLINRATQLVITEAKLFSTLSSGVKNATYFDQAARNVACIAEVLARARRRPEQLTSLGFFVLAPSEQISLNLFKQELSIESIRVKVSRRVSEYPSPDREKKEEWLREWFMPTLQHMRIQSISWEDLLDQVRLIDNEFALDFSDFYGHCLKFNRIQEREQP